MKQKTKRILKYLFGCGAGCILAGAVVGGIVSCSNGSTTQPQGQPTKPSGPAYQLQTQANTSTIAYKSNDTNSPTMIATNVSDYNTLISEPNNVIISVLGTPQAVINVANDTSSKTAPDITLDLNQNSQLFSDIINGTNNKTDLASLNNLITFTTTKNTTNKFKLNNYSADYVSNQEIGINNFSLDTFGQFANSINLIAVNFNGVFAYLHPFTFWSDLHPANNGTPSLTVTTTNFLLWNDKKAMQTPFNLTINLLPLIKFSTQPTTLSLNTKDEISYKGNTDGEIVNKDYPAWNLVANGTKITTNEFIYVNNTWYTNVPKDLEGLSITPIYIPATSKNPSELSSIPYIYVDNNMWVVGMTTPSSI